MSNKILSDPACFPLYLMEIALCLMSYWTQGDTARVLAALESVIHLAVECLHKAFLLNASQSAR